MYLAHAGHDHAAVLTDTSSDLKFTIAVGMLAVAAIAAAVFIYEMRKKPVSKTKSKKRKAKK